MSCLLPNRSYQAFPVRRLNFTLLEYFRQLQSLAKFALLELFLIISETAAIKGKVEVDALILNGMVEGEVNARERVEIHSRGKLYGTVFTPTLVIQDGGVLEGNCKMGAKPENESNPEGTGKPFSKNSDS